MWRPGAGPGEEETPKRTRKPTWSSRPEPCAPSSSPKPSPLRLDGVPGERPPGVQAGALLPCPLTWRGRAAVAPAAAGLLGPPTGGRHPHHGAGRGGTGSGARRTVRFSHAQGPGESPWQRLPGGGGASPHPLVPDTSTERFRGRGTLWSGAHSPSLTALTRLPAGPPWQDSKHCTPKPEAPEAALPPRHREGDRGAGTVAGQPTCSG